MTLEEAVKTSKSFREVMQKLGYTSRGGNSYVRLLTEAKAQGYDMSHFGSNNQRFTIEEICVENSTYTSISVLKKRLVKEGYMHYCCACCGNSGIWNDKPISLQLDHINGKCNDHRLENLRFLCPNCHSQTDTYAGKNKAVT